MSILAVPKLYIRLQEKAPGRDPRTCAHLFLVHPAMASIAWLTSQVFASRSRSQLTASALIIDGGRCVVIGDGGIVLSGRLLLDESVVTTNICAVLVLVVEVVKVDVPTMEVEVMEADAFDKDEVMKDDVFAVMEVGSGFVVIVDICTDDI